MEKNLPLSQIKLALGRLLAFFEENNYIVSTIYCENLSGGPQVRFIECRTPIQQKTFFIHIPEKYLMLLDSETIKIVTIKDSSEDGPKSRQFNYIANVKGPLLECDLVAISGINICAYKNSGKAYFYEIPSSEDAPLLEEIQEEEPPSEVEVLENQTREVLSKVKPGSSLPKPPEEPEPVSEEEPPKELPEEEPPQEEKPKELPGEKVEIIFKDPEGESIEDIKEFIVDEVPSEIEESLEEVKSKIKDKGSLIKLSEVPTSHDNSLPPELEDSNIVLGMVYFLSEIGSFYREVRANTFETKVIKICKQISDNILDMRKTRFADIKDLTSTFLETGTSRLSTIEEDERKLRTSLIRLTIVLREVMILKEKVTKDPKKFGDEIPEVERIYNQTRKIIYELNMELLELRDSADELLNNYRDTIKELIEL